MDGNTGEQAQVQSLPEHAVVVRGGVMTLEKVRSQTTVNFRDEGTYSLSVWVSSDLDASDLARAAREEDEEALRHTRMQVSTAGRIGAAGWQLVSSDPGRSLHHDLLLPARPADNEIMALMAAFDDPQPNPVARSS